MAIINTPLFKSQTGGVDTQPASVLVQGKIRYASVTIPSGTVLAVGDKVNLVQLPVGVRVLPVVSLTINGHATAKLNIGDAKDAVKYAADITAAARQPLTQFGNKPDSDVTDGGADVIGTVTTGGTLTTDWRLYIAYMAV